MMRQVRFNRTSKGRDDLKGELSPLLTPHQVGELMGHAHSKAVQGRKGVMQLVPDEQHTSGPRWWERCIQDRITAEAIKNGLCPTEHPGMSYFVRHLHGQAESDYPLAQLEALLDELGQAVGEHVQVELVHESEWSIAVSRNGRITLENVESSDEIYHMDSVSRPRTVELMTRLARGEIDSLLKERWTRGYG